MTTQNKDFDTAVRFVLSRECPNGDTSRCYVHDPDDPGGETNIGISKRKYPKEDIKNMTVASAKEIYFIDYWKKFGCDTLEWPMNLIVFDTAVNMHPTVVEGLRKSSNNWIDFLMRRLHQYALLALKRKDNKYPLLKFLPGWIIRIYRVYRYVNVERV